MSITRTFQSSSELGQLDVTVRIIGDEVTEDNYGDVLDHVLKTPATMLATASIMVRTIAKLDDNTNTNDATQNTISTVTRCSVDEVAAEVEVALTPSRLIPQGTSERLDIVVVKPVAAEFLSELSDVVGHIVVERASKLLYNVIKDGVDSMSKKNNFSEDPLGNTFVQVSPFPFGGSRI